MKFFIALGFYLLQVAVGIKGIFLDLKDTDRDIGTMVRHPLQIRDDIREDKAHLDGAFFISQTLYMALFQLLIELVDDLPPEVPLFPPGPYLFPQKQ